MTPPAPRLYHFEQPTREPEPYLTIRKGVRWHVSQMLSSRLKAMNSFDVSAMVAVGIIVVQLMLG